METNKWQVFEIGRRSETIEITFTKSKYLRFSPALISENNLENSKYVLIYIQENGDYTKIGFEFLKEKDSKGKSLKLGKPEKTTGAYCSGNSLFTRLKIKTEEINKSIHFTPTKEEFEGKKLFVIKIEK